MHGMTSTDQMYSVREAPWHAGQTNSLVLDVAPESRMARIIAAGQNWLVEEHDVFKLVPSPGDVFNMLPSYAKLEGWKMLTRSDNGDILHVAKTTYEVAQNIVGHELYEALAKGAVLDDGTGGTIKGGAVCYLTARLD